MPTSQLPPIPRLAAYMALESVKQFGPQKFREVLDAGLTPEEILSEPERLPIGGSRGETFRQAIEAFTSADYEEFGRRARLAVERAVENDSTILLVGDPLYPPLLWASNNPVPVLYARGQIDLLSNRNAVACVGSREIGGRYRDRQAEFARNAAREGFVVVSGFALGADSVAHRAAVEGGGGTICVMPCGLDRPFPPENRDLWHELLAGTQAVFVSEFPFATKAAALTLRKRNKTIVAFARGVLVGQSSNKGGAMNAFRFGVEQRKQVATFRDDGTDATSGNRTIAEAPTGTCFSAEEPDQGGWDAWLTGL